MRKRRRATRRLLPPPVDAEGEFSVAEELVEAEALAEHLAVLRAEVQAGRYRFCSHQRGELMRLRFLMQARVAEITELLAEPIH